MGCNVLTRPIGLLAVFLAAVVLTVREKAAERYHFRFRDEWAGFRTLESTLRLPCARIT
jgi:hypothetical protein